MNDALCCCFYPLFAPLSANSFHLWKENELCGVLRTEADKNLCLVCWAHSHRTHRVALGDHSMQIQTWLAWGIKAVFFSSQKMRCWSHLISTAKNCNLMLLHLSFVSKKRRTRKSTRTNQEHSDRKLAANLFDQRAWSAQPKSIHSERKVQLTSSDVNLILFPATRIAHPLQKQPKFSNVSSCFIPRKSPEEMSKWPSDLVNCVEWKVRFVVSWSVLLHSSIWRPQRCNSFEAVSLQWLTQVGSQAGGSLAPRNVRNREVFGKSCLKEGYFARGRIGRKAYWSQDFWWPWPNFFWMGADCDQFVKNGEKSPISVASRSWRHKIDHNL